MIKKKLQTQSAMWCKRNSWIWFTWWPVPEQVAGAPKITLSRNLSQKIRNCAPTIWRFYFYFFHNRIQKLCFWYKKIRENTWHLLIETPHFLKSHFFHLQLWHFWVLSETLHLVAIYQKSLMDFWTALAMPFRLPHCFFLVLIWSVIIATKIRYEYLIYI